MSVKYKVIVSKYGAFSTVANVETLKEANIIKDTYLDNHCYSGKCVIIEKTITTLVSETPFVGTDLTD